MSKNTIFAFVRDGVFVLLYGGFTEAFLDHTVEMKISLVRAVFPSWPVKKLYNKHIKRHLVENTVYYKEEK